MKEFEHQNALNLIIKQEQTNRKLTEARNAFLLAQINPHFLFNTLNYIYYLTYKTSPDGAKGILALSKMMRYTANSSNTNQYIYLSTEIEYVETLIYLHQMRHEHTSRFNFFYKENTKAITIIPLVLITIVENMFKYGDLNNEFSPSVKIEKDTHGYLIIETRNAIKFSKRDPSLGSGLKNVNERLDFAYSGKAKLIYAKDKLNRFHLTVKIPVNLDEVKS